MEKVSKEELFRLRNDVPISELMKALKIQIKFWEGYIRFPCFICDEWNTAINPKTNLARCFRCRKNYNTIDWVMQSGKLDFKTAVKLLRKIRFEIERSK